MNTLIIDTDNQTMEKIILFLQSLKIKFELKKEKENPYNEEFIKKIERSRQDYQDGKGKKITLDELNALWK